MHVYFARSIRGSRGISEDMKREHAVVLKTIKDAGHSDQFSLSVQLFEDYDDDNSSDKYIYQRDIMWLNRCDVMIADVTHPSHGVGYEIGYAVHTRKMPTMCIASIYSGPISAMITGNLLIHRYGEIQDVVNQIKDFLRNADEYIKARRQSQTDQTEAPTK